MKRKIRCGIIWKNERNIQRKVMDNTDVQRMLHALSSDRVLELADVNRDGNVNVADVLLMMRKLNGWDIERK